MSNKSKEPAIPAKDFDRIIKDFIKDLERREEEVKRPKKASGGFIEKPIYYTEKPGLDEIATRFRIGLEDGGLADDDISQMQYLVSVLEGATSLTPMEQKILEDLKKDLQRVGMGAAK